MKLSIRRLALTAAAMIALGTAEGFAAGKSGNEDLTVTFNASLDVQIDGVFDSTYTLGSLGAGAAASPASTATITNTSGGLTERWSLSVSTVAGNGDWAVASSTGDSGATATSCSSNCPGLDSYAFQAVFVSSNSAANACPNNSAKWDSVASVVLGPSSPQTYTSSRYADATVVSNASGLPDQTSGGHDGNMLSYNAGSGAGKRGLCTRLIMPSGSTSAAQQTIRLTVTAAAGS